MPRRVLEKKIVKNLSREDYNKCYSLNLRDRGQMRYSIDPDDVVYMIKDEDGKLLSWALVNRHFRTDNTIWADSMYYTRCECRRQGLGKRLANRIKKDFPEVYAHGWNEESIGFFSATEVRYY